VAPRTVPIRPLVIVGLLAGVLDAPAALDQPAPWDVAAANAERSQRAIRFCRRHAQGWLAHADPVSGLLPRTTTGQRFWNARDCAADNFPFIALTALATDDHHLRRATMHILERERALTRRLDALPDDFFFDTQGFRGDGYDLDALIFGASEYAKDGLLPLTEWAGRGPWVDRMEELVRDVWAHAPVRTADGPVPSSNIEVVGELLQTMSRLYWMSGDERYRAWTFRLADRWLLETDLTAGPSLRLRDHGCEIIGGLSEAYVLAAETDPARRERYRLALHALLDRILEIGVNEHGMMVNAVDPRDGAVLSAELSDGWGYVYDAFLTVALLDGVDRYRAAVAHALANVHEYPAHPWEGRGGADGYADSIEGAINLLNRIPDDSALQWVHEEIEVLRAKQRPDGIIEGWYGDGNSSRTMLMYALMTTQGVTASPWRDDLKLGAERATDGSVRVLVSSEWPWRGRLRFDIPRHRDVLHLPMDYPRINQFPEWFTVERDRRYVLTIEGREPRPVSGDELTRLELRVGAGATARLTVRPARADEALRWRSFRYAPGTPPAAVRTWQADLRRELAGLLRLDREAAARVPLDAVVVASTHEDGYALDEVELSATAGRRIRVVVGRPQGAAGPAPAVVCIHGHGGTRGTVFENERTYKRFAARLARRGFVTIAADVGQHEVAEAGRTLMGERLGDLMRCVDYLESMDDVDRDRIGCAGLSLGGEMAMWLAALDPRVVATVSSGFLTTMDQMEQGHCMCWKLPGLRALVDFADLYALIAPRALQCQNGLREPPDQFFVPIAERAMAEIRPAYADLDRPDRVELVVHPGGHEIDLPSLERFLTEHLGRR
jgi:acetyl esterase/lipase